MISIANVHHETITKSHAAFQKIIIGSVAVFHNEVPFKTLIDLTIKATSFNKLTKPDRFA